MQPVALIYLSQEGVISLKMPMGEVITIIENVLREHGLGHFENPPKPGIHPQPDAFIHGMLNSGRLLPGRSRGGKMTRNASSISRTHLKNRRPL